MSLTNSFISIHETRILLTEVSRGKRNALLEKLIKLFYEYFPDERYKDCLDLLENSQYVERIFNVVDLDMSWNDVNNNYTSHDVTDRMNKFNDIITKEIIFPSMVFVFKHFEEIDPTNNMKYGNWLIDKVCDHFIQWGYFSNYLEVDALNNAKILFKKNGVFFEDYPKFANYLEHYDEMKRKNELPDEYKDINKLDDDFKYINRNGKEAVTNNPIEIIKHITKEHRTLKEKNVFKAIDNNLKEGSDYELLAKDKNGFNIYKPITQKAKSILGMNTEWCTTYGKHCTNPDYQDRSPMEYDDLFILINTSDQDEKYQIHFDSNQFMDRDDRLVDPRSFFNNHEEIGKWFINNELDKVASNDKIGVALFDKFFEDVFANIDYGHNNISLPLEFRSGYNDAEERILTLKITWNGGKANISIDRVGNDYLVVGYMWGGFFRNYKGSDLLKAKEVALIYVNEIADYVNSAYNIDFTNWGGSNRKFYSKFVKDARKVIADK